MGTGSQPLTCRVVDQLKVWALELVKPVFEFHFYPLRASPMTSPSLGFLFCKRELRSYTSQDWWEDEMGSCLLYTSTSTASITGDNGEDQDGEGEGGKDQQAPAPGSTLSLACAWGCVVRLGRHR